MELFDLFAYLLLALLFLLPLLASLGYLFSLGALRWRRTRAYNQRHGISPKAAP